MEQIDLIFQAILVKNHSGIYEMIKYYHMYVHIYIYILLLSIVYNYQIILLRETLHSGELLWRSMLTVDCMETFAPY